MDRFKMDYFIAMIPKVIKLLPATVKAALLSLLLSLLLGLVLAVVRQYKIKGLYALSSIYVSFFRGTPFIAQLFLFYYGLATISTTIKDEGGIVEEGSPDDIFENPSKPRTRQFLKKFEQKHAMDEE